MIYQYAKGSSGELSPNFRKAEFACKCSRCSMVTVDMELVDILQRIRDHFGKPVNINSGYRCEKHNAEVGGAAGSHHTKGMAADIRVKGVAPREVAKFAESIGVKRIGLYEGDEGEFVHIGSGKEKRFWLGHGIKIVDTFGGGKGQTDKPALKFKKGDIVRFGGGNHYASSNASSGPVVKESRAKITDVYEAGIHPYHCRAVNDAGAFIGGVYGWVNAVDLSAIVAETPVPKPTPPTTPVGPAAIKKDDIVSIAKNATYYSGNDVPDWVVAKNWIVSEAPVGDRVVINKSVDGKHAINSPIHAKFLTVVKADEPWTPKVGDIVNYNGTKHYANANAASGSSCKGGRAKITNIYQLGKSKHPYHLVRVSGKGATVYGWVDEGSFAKI